MTSPDACHTPTVEAVLRSLVRHAETFLKAAGSRKTDLEAAFLARASYTLDTAEMIAEEFQASEEVLELVKQTSKRVRVPV